MAEKRRELPETMMSPVTGRVLTRDVRPFTVRYKGESTTVDLPGYYAPDNDEDGVLIGSDMAPADAALRVLKERVEGLPSPATIRRLRRKLKMTRREAGKLLKVGEDAFDQYERGLTSPSGPVQQLLKLLDRHPEMVDELR